ncbi:MAG TPA: phosphotransferase [Kofleriaceae bacterium]|nr:phosphotransferase [Kofleriaceae bacterium]
MTRQQIPDDIRDSIIRTFGTCGDVTPMAGGKSGALLFVTQHDGQAYVVRKIGERGRAKADRELACMKIAADAGIGARVVFGEGGIVIMDKLPGAPITRGTSREGDPLGRLAATLRTLHAAPRFPDGPQLGQMFAALASNLPLPEVLPRAVAAAEHDLAADPVLVPCHRDLNPTNILATPERIHLIDWEQAGNSDPLFDLAQLGIWVCRDDSERAHLLASYLGRAPIPAEQRRAVLNRILALAFYGAAFCVVSAVQGKPPAAGTATLEDIFATMAATGQPFEPDHMAGAMVRQLEREARAQGLLS